MPYEIFLKDVAEAVVDLMRQDGAGPEFVSQRKAFELFGRANVERWRRLGLIEPAIRPGKVEYRTAELRLLQRRKQDYFQL